MYVCMCVRLRSAWCLTSSPFTTAVSAVDIQLYVIVVVVVAADCAFVVATTPATI